MMPQNIHLLFAFGRCAYNDLVGKMFLWLFMVSSCLVLFDLTRRLFGYTAAWVALFIFVFTPWTNYNVHVPLVEGGIALFLLAAANAFRRGLPADRRTWWYLAAIYVGIAAGSKHSALAALPVCFAFLAWHRVRSDRVTWTRGLATAAAVTALAGLVGAPWYLRNWIYLGNPVWPFFIGGAYLDPGGSGTTAAHLISHGAGWDRLAFFVRTILFSYGPDCFSFFHPALAICAPLVLIYARWNRRLAALSVLAIGTLAFNYVWAGYSSRYWFPYYAIVCAALGAAFVTVTRHRWLRGPCWGLLILAACSTFTYEAIATVQLARHTSRRQFESTTSPPRDVCAICEQEVGGDQRIMAIAATNLYFRRPAIVAAFRQGWCSLQGLHTPDILLRRLRERRIGVLLFDREYTEPGAEPAVKPLRDAIDALASTGKLREIHRRDPYVVYRVIDHPSVQGP